MHQLRQRVDNLVAAKRQADMDMNLLPKEVKELRSNEPKSHVSQALHAHAGLPISEVGPSTSNAGPPASQADLSSSLDGALSFVPSDSGSEK
ncbi:hypothetical protein PAXRUDRAFT_20962 [Paxillus rubicundulus Ve08.2h10]|uniref:Uncharacterized protein n=1 Tax=Paxillus rubicundulus Ve08.2h10 TaxID=930991 RepID=A0A0D0BP77_9AGAM|nr:hypothetical protein PAXRUDRAFT_20962 [Paxillus rubicundulus Ve08.2h10]